MLSGIPVRNRAARRWSAALRRQLPCLLSVGLSSGVLFAQEPNASPGDARPAAVAESEDPEVAALIEQLGDAEPQRCEQAARDLIELGNRALPALQRQARHPNSEVRLRIVEVTSEIRRKDVDQRLARLVSGEVDPASLALPAWQRWAELVGDDRDSRAFYAEVAKGEWGLLKFADTASDEEIARRVSALFTSYGQGTLQPMSLATYTGCLFLTCDHEQLDSATIVGFSNYSRMEPIRGSIAQGRRSDPLKRMLDRMITNMDEGLVTIGLQMAIEHELPGGRKLSLDMLRDGGRKSEHLIRTALSALVRLGTKEDLPAIVQVFEDRRAIRVFLMNQQQESQLRDFALTTAAMILDESLDDYGLIVYPPVPKSQWSMGINVGFADEAARDAAFVRWSERHPAEATGDTPDETAEEGDGTPTSDR